MEKEQGRWKVPGWGGKQAGYGTAARASYVEHLAPYADPHPDLWITGPIDDAHRYGNHESNLIALSP